MGDKILKGIEAILGGVATFLGLYFLLRFLPEPKPFDFDIGLLTATLLFLALGFSFSMIFVYYHLLTKNKVLSNDRYSVTQSPTENIWEDRKMLIGVGLLIAISFNFFVAGLYDVLVMVLTFPYIFVVPFILTRKWSWLTRIISILILFAGFFIFSYLLTL